MKKYSWSLKDLKQANENIKAAKAELDQCINKKRKKYLSGYYYTMLHSIRNKKLNEIRSDLNKSSNALITKINEQKEEQDALKILIKKLIESKPNWH